MNPNTLSQGEPWMTPGEHDLNRHFIQAITTHLAIRGVPATPLILLRINDIIVTWLLARRLESALTPQPGELAPCPTPAQAGAIGKCRDRLRRAMKDLEACCPRDTAPDSGDLVDQLLQAAQQHTAPAPPVNHSHLNHSHLNHSHLNHSHLNHSHTTEATGDRASVETHKAENADSGPSQIHDPAENRPPAETTHGQPEPPNITSTSNPPPATPEEQPPPMNRAARRRHEKEQRRKKRRMTKHARAS